MALRGVRVIEMAGLAPAPFCGMVLSDFGADVIRVNRTNEAADLDCLTRGKRSIAVDVKHKEGQQIFHSLCQRADVLLEPFRAGVMEKLGFGPDTMLKENPGLVYARLTGYGQHGCFKERAGHDINYLALSGVLSFLGRKECNPTPPINLLADFCGGGLLCSLGIMLALYERTNTGRGQVVDANMVEGSAYIGSWLYRSNKALPIWGSPRGHNVLDGGAHFYDTYKTKDFKYMAVGAIEPQFYAAFLKGIDRTEEELPQYGDSDASRRKVAQIFATRTQAQWCQVFDGTDACVTPVLTPDQVREHAHNSQRRTFRSNPACASGVDPRPAPTLGSDVSGPSDDVSPAGDEVRLTPGRHTRELLYELGYADEDVSRLVKSGAVQCNDRGHDLDNDRGNDRSEAMHDAPPSKL